MDTARIAGRRLSFCGCGAPGPVAFSARQGRFVAESLPTHADDAILMPPLVNAHDHARGVRPTALGAFDMPLELWLTAMTGTPRCDPFKVVAAALGRQAEGGCGAVMIHYTRPQDAARVPEELRIAAQAAAAVGIRVAIAPALRDRNALGYTADEAVLARLPGPARAAMRARLLTQPPASPDEQIRLVDELADAIGNEMVEVQYGPYGLEWCSDALLEGVAARSAMNGRRVHMHLLETRIQREYLDACHPDGGPVRHLDRLGLLSPRLSVAHGAWLRPDEMELLAERGVTVAVNSSSNLALRHGRVSMTELARRGVPIAMGLDGFTLDDDDDAFRELRLNWRLEGGTWSERGLGPAALLDIACHGGRQAVLGDRLETALTEGAPADALVLDRRRLMADVVVPVADADIVAQRATRAVVQGLWVAGREVVRDGRLATLDLPALQAELDAEVRRGAEGFAAWRQVTDAWRDVLARAYGAGLHRRGDAPWPAETDDTAA